MSEKTTLVFGIVIILCIVILSQVIQFELNSQIQVISEYDLEMTVPSLFLLNTLEGSFAKMNGHVYEYVMTGFDDEKRYYFESQETIEKTLKKYDDVIFIKNSNGDYIADEETRKQMQEFVLKFDSMLNEYLLYGEQMMDSTYSQKNSDVQMQIRNEVELGEQNITNLIMRTKEIGQNTRILNDNLLYELSATNSNLLLITSVLETVLILVIVIVMYRSINVRMNLVKKFANLENMSTIGEMSARIAHDVRNPLGVIKNSLFLLESLPENNPNAAKYLQIMHKSVEKIDHQINDVLNFVKGHDLNIESSCLLNIVKNSLKNLTIPHNVTVNLIPSDSELQLEVDPYQMDIVFTNILLNSIQSIGDDVGTITIKVVEDSDDVSIEFIDSGVLNADINKIFEPLYTTKMTGTGLGLVSCKKIIDAHNGKINAKSFPTTFTITLPKINK